MKPIYFLLLAALLGAAVLVTLRRTKKDLSTASPQEIAKAAYIWGYPLVVMERSKQVFTQKSGTPLNTFKRYEELITPAFKEVVTPNVDTLYSIAWLDLIEPLVLRVPDTADRYYVVQFLDAYTTAFKNIGKRTTGTKAGTYLIVGPDWTGDAPEGMTVIKAPTTMVWLITRVLVKDQADVSQARDILNAITLEPLKGSPKERYSPAPVGMPQDVDKAGIKFFGELGVALENNTILPADSASLEAFKTIGVGPGKMPSQEGTEEHRKILTQAVLDAEIDIDKKVASLGKKYSTSWDVAVNAGDYGDDYLLRAAFAKKGLGANVPEESVYGIAQIDVSGEQLSGANSYVVHFKELPPVDAFWSVTMYDSNTQLLAPNPLKRYALSDRSQVTYNDDGSLDIYVQHTKPEKESNWLPAPKGNFYLVLRMYMPTKAILDGSYEYPVIKKVG